MIELSDRLMAMEESATIAMSRKSRELKAEGIDVISLSNFSGLCKELLKVYLLKKSVFSKERELIEKENPSKLNWMDNCKFFISLGKVVLLVSISFFIV